MNKQVIEAAVDAYNAELTAEYLEAADHEAIEAAIRTADQARAENQEQAREELANAILHALDHGPYNAANRWSNIRDVLNEWIIVKPEDG